MAKNLLAYVLALWTDMVARMSSIVSLLFTVWQTYSEFFSGSKGTVHSHWYWWLVAVACFIFANFRIWLDERKLVISQQPKFTLQIDHLDYEYTADENETVLVFAVSIVNEGAPSVARFWSGKFQMGIVPEVMKALWINEFWVLRPSRKGDLPIVLKPQDQIISKTIESRLETGDAKVGRAFFSLPGDRRSQLLSLNYTATITVQDFKGNEFSAKFLPHSVPVFESKTYPGESVAPSKFMRLLEEAREEKNEA